MFLCILVYVVYCFDVQFLMMDGQHHCRYQVHVLYLFKWWYRLPLHPSDEECRVLRSTEPLLAFMFFCFATCDSDSSIHEIGDASDGD